METTPGAAEPVKTEPVKAEPAMAEPDWIAITPMRLELVESYRECLGTVARERKYLMMTDAPSPEESRDFVKYVLEANFPLYAAVIPGPTVVGWCDITPSRYESRAHVGTLGLGVHKDFRGQGLGRLLMERALKHARRVWLERVELDVYSSNTRALALYKSFEFEVEGVKRRARKFDSVYEDVIMMAKYY